MSVDNDGNYDKVAHFDPTESDQNPSMKDRIMGVAHKPEIICGLKLQQTFPLQEVTLFLKGTDDPEEQHQILDRIQRSLGVTRLYALPISNCQNYATEMRNGKKGTSEDVTNFSLAVNDGVNAGLATAKNFFDNSTIYTPFTGNSVMSGVGNFCTGIVSALIILIAIIVIFLVVTLLTTARSYKNNYDTCLKDRKAKDYSSKLKESVKKPLNIPNIETLSKQQPILQKRILREDSSMVEKQQEVKISNRQYGDSDIESE